MGKKQSINIGVAVQFGNIKTLKDAFIRRVNIFIGSMVAGNGYMSANRFQTRQRVFLACRRR